MRCGGIGGCQAWRGIIDCGQDYGLEHQTTKNLGLESGILLFIYLPISYACMLMKKPPDDRDVKVCILKNMLGLSIFLEQFKKAVELDPKNFKTNHNLGESYIRAGRIPQAAPFLEKAQQIDPSSYDNGYDLSLAYIQIGRLSDARQLLPANDKGECRGDSCQPVPVHKPL